MPPRHSIKQFKEFVVEMAAFLDPANNTTRSVGGSDEDYTLLREHNDSKAQAMALVRSLRPSDRVKAAFLAAALLASVTPRRGGSDRGRSQRRRLPVSPLFAAGGIYSNIVGDTPTPPDRVEMVPTNNNNENNKKAKTTPERFPVSGPLCVLCKIDSERHRPIVTECGHFLCRPCIDLANRIARMCPICHQRFRDDMTL